MKYGTFIACCGAFQAALFTAPQAIAQVATPVLPYNLGDAVRDADAARRAPLPPPQAQPVLPQVSEPRLVIKDHETLFVRSIEVEGPNLIASAEVQEVLAPFENRKLTLSEIYDAADKVTTLYRTRGYLVAKAYVPAQDARGGVLRIKLIPGQYGEIALKNQSLVRDDFLQALLGHALGGSPYVQKDPLERAMLLTSDLPGAAMPRVAVGPGREAETSDFVLNVPEGRRFDGYLVGDNFGSPYTGRDRVSASLSLNSPLGYGDRLYAFGIVSQETNLVNGRVAYAFPIGYDGMRGEIGAFRTTYVLGGVYESLDGTGVADGLTATLTYPIARQRDHSIYVAANYTHKELNDKVLGASVANRTIDLATLSVSGDTFGSVFGLPVTTSTTFSYTAGNVDFPDYKQMVSNIVGADTYGIYERVNLSFNATLALNDKLSLSTLLRAQKSLSGNLDSSEQMSLTGYWGVRSYDEGLSGDSGYLVTPELKYALPDFYLYRHSLGLFTDVGAAWLADGSYTTTQRTYTQLNDIGLGYYATFEYSQQRFFLIKAQVAHTYGSDTGASTYNRGTKGLFQVGLTF
ncbi:ShlB/FhaC/HecB family hemolysin secretion/activation protein [Methylocapsa acidiphila]|uniref:ShlB/FhaC/HecB family hemolysin secretion/activation protein n=1 Tax=Methylocapsa acidiphila TaxID=133552 RepID=UPI000405816C|nr:ShlB/FhaC/HecB family hemolysin secretion/activation protein [Methylocapsa acidiphila]